MRRLLLASAVMLCLVAPARAAPDALRGEQVYTRCLACHALAYDRVGPRHCGLFGRRAGSAMTYDGVADPKERADLIAYLERVNETPECVKAVPQRVLPAVEGDRR